MTNSNKKGDRREREIINFLDGNGWAVIRAPASGSATERELPDVLFGNGDVFIASEIKASSGDPIYLSGEEVEALDYFATSFGAQAKIGVKFDLSRDDEAWGNEDRPGFWFIDTDDLYETDGGNYRVKKPTAHEIGVKEIHLGLALDTGE